MENTKCTVLEEHHNQTRVRVMSMPNSPGKTIHKGIINNDEFPLRILVPSEMVGAIIDWHITTSSKTRVDVLTKGNLVGSTEVTI